MSVGSRFDDQTLKSVAVKYVALLAFQRIATSYPHLAAGHQDLIFGCLDNLDISIRLQALKIGSQMVDSANLPSIVTRLVRQVEDASTQARMGEVAWRQESNPIEPSGDLDGEDPAENLRSQRSHTERLPPIPVEYQVAVISEILDMCSRDSFANIDDFEWYINVMVDLLRYVPHNEMYSNNAGVPALDPCGVSSKIGSDLRNIAVRVPSVRSAVIRAAISLLIAGASETWTTGPGKGALAHAVWIVGEYADSLSSSEDALSHFSLLPLRLLEPEPLSICLQTIPKILASTLRMRGRVWNPGIQSTTSLFLARIKNLLEPLVMHTDLEVQERAVECLELVELSSEAVALHSPHDLSGPTVLIDWIPSLYHGSELNPVAATAQRKVPVPDDLDFAQPLNSSLPLHLAQQESLSLDSHYQSGLDFYYERPSGAKLGIGVNTGLHGHETKHRGDLEESPYTGADLPSSRTDSHNRGRPDDPFYINNNKNSSAFPQSIGREPLKGSSVDLDLESIPIMALGPGDAGNDSTSQGRDPLPLRPNRRRYHVAAEENIDVPEPGQGGSSSARTFLAPLNPTEKRRVGEGLLQIDSSGIGRLDLQEDVTIDQAGNREEEEEMAKALADVERMRMEMQRTAERAALASSVAAEGTVIKKKTKKKRKKLTRQGETLPSNNKGTNDNMST